MNKNIFTIYEAQPENVEATRTIVKNAWLRIYPNEKYGITREDIESIDFHKPESIEKRIKEILEKGDIIHTWVLKNAENSVVGFCKVRKEQEYGEILGMYLIPEVQGKGLGKKLMQKAFEWLDPKLDIRLQVVSYNKNAIEFYKKLGFKETQNKVLYEETQIPSGKEIPRIEMVREARSS